MTDQTGQLTYPLKTPIESGKQTITELVFQPICGRHIMAINRPESDGVRYMLELAGQLCGQTMEVMHKLSGVDVSRVITMSNAFFLGIPMTGDKPSE